MLHCSCSKYWGFETIANLATRESLLQVVNTKIMSSGNGNSPALRKEEGKDVNRGNCLWRHNQKEYLLGEGVSDR